MTTERAHHKPIVHALESCQGLDAVHVHQVARTRDPELHHRQKALPSCQNPGVLPVPAEEIQRFIHGPW